MLKRSVGMVDKQFISFGKSIDNELDLESGKKFGPVTLAYEVYGKLNKRKDNAILIFHSLTMDSHAAGKSTEGKNQIGWWDEMIGPGKAFDTNRYFIICSNVIGGCSGSTGPSSIDPETGKPYGLNFPFITLSDMVKGQKRLTDHLGVKKLLSVAGGSMGGMLALQWFADYPETTRSVIPIASAWKQSPQQIAFSEVGRQAIMRDPNWNKGDYYDEPYPKSGLSIARMIGHITYMSEIFMEKKFSRRLKKRELGFSFDNDFEIENYLNYNGDSLIDRFDPNSYLYLSKALNYFDVSGEKLIRSKVRPATSFLIISFDSDWLYPSWQSKEIVKFLMSKRVSTTYCEISSPHGHDSFLLEFEEETKLIKHFLEKVQNEQNS